MEVDPVDSQQVFVAEDLELCTDHHLGPLPPNYTVHRLRGHALVLVKSIDSVRFAADEMYAKGFEDEVIVASSPVLPHPNVARFLGYTCQEGFVSIVEELPTFRPSISQELLPFPVNSSAMRQLMLDLSRGLAHLHSHDFVHGDLRPDRIRLFGGPGRMVAKIADFGSAADVRPITIAGVEIRRGRATPDESADPRSMAPEVARGNHVDFASDVFSLGLVFFQLLTGVLRGHYGAATDEQVHDVMRRGGRLAIGTLPRAAQPTLRDITALCLSFEPTRRPTAAQVVAALESDEIPVFSGNRTVQNAVNAALVREVSEEIAPPRPRAAVVP